VIVVKASGLGRGEDMFGENSPTHKPCSRTVLGRVYLVRSAAQAGAQTLAVTSALTASAPKSGPSASGHKRTLHDYLRLMAASGRQRKVCF